MSLFNIPPPPVGEDIKSPAWRHWFYLLKNSLASVIGIGQGGTGLSSLGTSNQVLGVNSGATGLEYKSVLPGTNVSIVHAAGSITINSTGGSGASYHIDGGVANSTYVGPQNVNGGGA
jgi:hypothetical protein